MQCPQLGGTGGTCWHLPVKDDVKEESKLPDLGCEFLNTKNEQALLLRKAGEGREGGKRLPQGLVE